MAAPTFSVIVVCRNPGRRLAATLDSVWQQRGAAAEPIVIDGASNDGTRERLEADRSRFAALVSEPDDGVYAAMNKGIALARGEWVLFLGADDRLAHDTVLADAARNLVDTEAAVTVGEAAYDDGRIYRLATRPRPIARNFVHHQATLYRRTVFQEHGGFDATLRIMADYDFNLRLWKSHVRFRSLALRLAVCGTGGLSDRGGWLGYREEIAVRHRHFPAWQCLGWDAISVLRFVRKRIVRTIRAPHG